MFLDTINSFSFISVIDNEPNMYSSPKRRTSVDNLSKAGLGDLLFDLMCFSHNILSCVSFSNSRDGIDLNGWISSFQTPQNNASYYYYYCYCCCEWTPVVSGHLL